MRLSIEDHTKGLIVSITGKLDATTAPVFKEEILARIDRSNKNIIFDLSNLNYLSSAGIRVFYLISRLLKEKEKNMSFCSPTPDVMQVFEMIELPSDFPIFSDVDKALEKL
jgi:anti-anti-sigma factor